MFTIVASRITINWASPTTPRIHQRWAGPAATPDDPARSDTATTAGSLNTGAYVRRRRLRKAACQTRYRDASMSTCRTPSGHRSSSWVAGGGGHTRPARRARDTAGDLHRLRPGLTWPHDHPRRALKARRELTRLLPGFCFRRQSCGSASCARSGDSKTGSVIPMAVSRQLVVDTLRRLGYSRQGEEAADSGWHTSVHRCDERR